MNRVVVEYPTGQRVIMIVPTCARIGEAATYSVHDTTDRIGRIVEILGPAFQESEEGG